MQLITNLEQLIKNIETVERYLTEGKKNEMTKMALYIKRGIDFLAYEIGNEIRFAPSKILGYKENSLKLHKPSETDGRITTRTISSILKQQPKPDGKLEKLYVSYCHNLGVQPGEKATYGKPRKYWKLDIPREFKSNANLKGEFPEGKIVERIHKVRERNYKVIQLAKDNFKKKNGKLFCQVCKFDFEKTYGEIGKDFIEAHHTISVSEMKPEHKTKPEDIAILCSNCHTMVHKKRPWLKMEELTKLLNPT